jgi:hypothetical protein
MQRTPEWLQRLVDTPSPADIWLPAGILASMAALVVYLPTSNILQIALMVAVGSSLYFLFRKEKKLGRTVLLAVGGLFLGFAFGSSLSAILQSQVPGLGLDPKSLTLCVTFFILWLVSSFLR